MNDPAATDLSRLRDVVPPEAPSWWPPADGVWVLVAILLALVFLGFATWRRRRRANAYRRAGLALLATAETVRDVDVVLKRVALAVFPRATVAPLYGPEWASFLRRTGPGDFDVVDPAGPATPELLATARRWIRHHRHGGGS